MAGDLLLDLAEEQQPDRAAPFGERAAERVARGLVAQHARVQHDESVQDPPALLAAGEPPDVGEFLVEFKSSALTVALELAPSRFDVERTVASFLGTHAPPTQPP